MSESHPKTPHHFKALPYVAAAACLAVLVSSCGHQAGGTIEVYETVGYQPNHGPFDSNGNYVDKWADNPPKRRYISRSKKKSAPIAPAPQPQYVAAPPTAAKPAKVYKPSPPKVTAKPKKKSTRVHTVKRGDTLYGLSRKYGTSVSSIQKANRIKGTTIGIGQRLTIPR